MFFLQRQHRVPKESSPDKIYQDSVEQTRPRQITTATQCFINTVYIKLSLEETTLSFEALLLPDRKLGKLILGNTKDSHKFVVYHEHL